MNILINIIQKAAVKSKTKQKVQFDKKAKTNKLILEDHVLLRILAHDKKSEKMRTKNKRRYWPKSAEKNFSNFELWFFIKVFDHVQVQGSKLILTLIKLRSK